MHPKNKSLKRKRKKRSVSASPCRHCIFRRIKDIIKGKTIKCPDMKRHKYVACDDFTTAYRPQQGTTDTIKEYSDSKGNVKCPESDTCPESDLKFLQDALAHLERKIQEERDNLVDVERRLEELSMEYNRFETDKRMKVIARNIGQYEKKKIVISEAIQQFLHKGV